MVAKKKRKVAKKATKKRKVAKKKTTKRKVAKKRTTKKKATKKKAKKKVTKKKATKKKAKKKVTKKKATKKKAKKKATKKKSKRKPNKQFMKPLKPSAALAKVVGAKPLPRTQVVKKLWAHIKKKKLQNPKNRRNIVADALLKPIFNGKKEVSMFEMTKLVNKHLS